MNETEIKQNEVEDLLIIEQALRAYKTKLTKQKTCVPLLKESRENKLTIIESIQAMEVRTNKLIKKTVEQINLY